METKTKKTESEIKIKPIILKSSNGNLNINEFNIFNDICNSEPYTNIQTEYLDLIKLNELNVFEAKIIFSSKKWDFSVFKNDFNKSKTFVLNFSLKKGEYLSDFYETVLKLLILNCILEDGCFRPYVYEMFSKNKNFLEYLMANNIFKLEYCTVYNINSFLSLQRAMLKETTIAKYQTYILKLFNFYCTLTNKEIDHQINNALTIRNRNALKITAKNGLIKLLPSSFMNTLTTALYEDIMQTDTDNSNDDELYCCRIQALLFILTQTGLRPEEVLIVPYDCITIKTYNDLKVSRLTYYSTKSVYGDDYKKNTTVANKKVLEVLDHIKKFYFGKYLGDGIEYKEIKDYFYTYCENNCKRLNNTSDKPDSRFMVAPRKTIIDGKEKYINIPRIKQFRVYFDSELKRRGFNDFARAKLLGHNDEKMLDYYGRDVTTIEEDVNFSQILVKDFTKDNDLKILGPKGNIYTNRIRKFLSKKKIKGIDDIEKVSKELMLEMPIRTKLGGCCIKPYSNAECNKNDNTDEYLCSYGLCENQCHFFYNCIYYYEQFHEMIKAYDHNINEGYEKFANKELYKIKHLLTGKLIPELNELKETISKKGIDAVKENYPQVINVIDHIEDIEGEINLWMNKKARK